MFIMCVEGYLLRGYGVEITAQPAASKRDDR